MVQEISESRKEIHDLARQLLFIFKKMIAEIEPQLTYLDLHFESIMKRYSDYFESNKQNFTNYEFIRNNSIFVDINNEGDFKRWHSLVSELVQRQDQIVRIINGIGSTARNELTNTLAKCQKFIDDVQPIVDSEQLLTCSDEELESLIDDKIVSYPETKYVAIESFFQERTFDQVFTELTNEKPLFLLSCKYNTNTGMLGNPLNSLNVNVKEKYYERWFHKWNNPCKNQVVFELLDRGEIIKSTGIVNAGIHVNVETFVI